MSLHACITTNVYRDLASGYPVAEILSRYYPQDIELKVFMNASSLSIKLANWQRLKKVLCC